MKVAIASEGAELASEASQRFGRAPYFIIADTEDGSFHAVQNEQNVNAAQGAGIQSAQTVVDQGVEAVVAGHCGPNAFKVLETTGVAVHVSVSGTVEEVLAKFKAGNLEVVSQADVEGHWA